MDIKKLPNENIKSYKIRLFSNSFIYNLNSQKIADLINAETGDNYNESTYRKWWKTYSEALEDCKNIKISENDLIQEIEDKKFEVNIEKNKVRSLRLDVDRKIREHSRIELLYEEYIESLKNITKEPIPDFVKLKPQKSDECYVLSFADSHFGKKFKSITNEYDIDIFYTRFNDLYNQLVILLEEQNINKLIILSLGDLVEGMCLRVSQLQSLQVGMTDQSLLFQRYIVKWLNKLSEHVQIDYYQTKSSNHSQWRPHGSNRNDFILEDIERNIYAYIHDMLDSNKRINIIESEDIFTIFKIFDYNIIALHGHEIKNMRTYLRDISWKYRIFFDYCFSAHKHEGGTIVSGEGLNNNCEMIKVPSIMGCDEYADELLVGAKPGAILVKFTNTQGKRTIEDIILK